jgi:excisionase family DNA binding protein
MSVQTSNRFTVMQIAKRLGLGKMAVYRMLQDGIVPGIRVGRRWIITRHAYEQWEKTCGQIRPAVASVIHTEFLT